MWDSSGEGVIDMQVSNAQVRGASTRTRAAAQDVPTGQVPAAASAGASAVTGGQLAAALDEAGPELRRRLRVFATTCEQWTFDLEASVAAYEDTDTTTAGHHGRLASRAV